MVPRNKKRKTVEMVGRRRVGPPIKQITDQEYAISRFEDRLTNGERLQDFAAIAEEIYSKKTGLRKLDEMIPIMKGINDPRAEPNAIYRESLYKEISELTKKEAVAKDFLQCAKLAEAASTWLIITERKSGRYRSLSRLTRVLHHAQSIMKEAKPIIMRMSEIKQKEHRESDKAVDKN